MGLFVFLMSSLGFAFEPIPVRFEPNEITQKCDQALQKFEQSLQAIEKLKPIQRSFANTLLAYERAVAQVKVDYGPLTLPADLFSDTKVREEAQNCKKKFQPVFSALPFRRSLYQSFLGFKPKAADDLRLWRETVREFERNGAALTGIQSQQAKKIQQRLGELNNQFTENLANFSEKSTFTAQELEGVDLAQFERFRDSSGTYRIQRNIAFLKPILDRAHSAETRKKAYEAYVNVAAKENLPIMQEVVDLRKKAAQLLGYKSWFDFRTSGKMARNESNVRQFLESLRGKTRQAQENDLALLRANRAEQLKGRPEAAHDLQLWDVFYYAERVRATKFQVDESELSKYFPVEVVLPGVMNIYSQVLGVQFRKLSGIPVWSSDVEVYEVLDAKSGQQMGVLYLDLYARELKVSGAFYRSMVERQTRSLEKPTNSVGVLLTNFAKGVAGASTLLKYEDVSTFFHEFGHAMHGTLSQAPFASLAGPDVRWDFVEAPSQMLENWMTDLKAMQMISKHVETGKPIDAELLKRVEASQKFLRGYATSRQLMLAEMDLYMHRDKPYSPLAKLFPHLSWEFSGFRIPEDFSFVGSFRHMMGGYDGGYYGYLWSEVYAQDMFTKFQNAKNGVLDAEVGMSYRREILEPGNLKEPDELLKKFLGRPPNRDAFFRYLGVEKN